MMLEKKKIIRRQRTLGNGDGDSFSEQGVEEFRDSRLTEIEMRYLMNSWRGRVKTVVRCSKNYVISELLHLCKKTHRRS